MNIFKLTLTMFAKLCVIVCLCVNIWAEESKPEYQNALNNLISRLGTTTNNTSDNLVFMPPTFSVDIVSLLRWAVESQTQGTNNIRQRNNIQVNQEKFTPGPVYTSNSLSLTEFNGKKYFFAKNQKFTWLESITFCRLYGMELVSIETAEEDNFIVQQLTNLELTKNGVWTSGNKVGRATYLWLNGEQLIYENWQKGEPAAPATENCLILYLKKWYDWACNQNTQHTYETYFICEEP